MQERIHDEEKSKIEQGDLKKDINIALEDQNYEENSKNLNNN